MATSMLLGWWSACGLAATFTHVPSPQRFRCSDSKVSLSSLFLPISLVNLPSLNSGLPALPSLFSLILLSLPCLPACNITCRRILGGVVAQRTVLGDWRHICSSRSCHAGGGGTQREGLMQWFLDRQRVMNLSSISCLEAIFA